MITSSIITQEYNFETVDIYKNGAHKLLSDEVNILVANLTLDKTLPICDNLSQIGNVNLEGYFNHLLPRTNFFECKFVVLDYSGWHKFIPIFDEIIFVVSMDNVYCVSSCLVCGNEIETNYMIFDDYKIFSDNKYCASPTDYDITTIEKSVSATQLILNHNISEKKFVVHDFLRSSNPNLTPLLSKTRFYRRTELVDLLMFNVINNVSNYIQIDDEYNIIVYDYSSSSNNFNGGMMTVNIIQDILPTMDELGECNNGGGTGGGGIKNIMLYPLFGKFINIKLLKDDDTLLITNIDNLPTGLKRNGKYLQGVVTFTSNKDINVVYSDNSKLNITLIPQKIERIG